MTVFIKRDIVTDLINKKFGGVTELASDWEDVSLADPDFPPAKKRSSIYNWLSSGVPVQGTNSRYNILALSGLLDVDPLCIFDFKRNGYFSSFTKIRKIIYLGQDGMGSIGPLFELYRPSDTWPSTSLARKYYGRDWHRVMFSNSDVWQNTEYHTIKASFTEDAGKSPRAVHIAYRRLKSSDQMWRYYGTVLNIDDNTYLYTEGGDFDEMKSDSRSVILFRTYFGARPVEFCVSSLHQFELTTSPSEEGSKIIGFKW